MAAQARQVLAACEKSPSDAVPLAYDARNPFDICSLTFTPIYRGNKVGGPRGCCGGGGVAELGGVVWVERGGPACGICARTFPP